MDPHDTTTMLTLAEAATHLGYKDTGRLRHAIRETATLRLQTIRRGKRMHFTTPAWLYAFDVAQRQGDYRRGTPRRTPPPPDQDEEKR